MRPADPQDGSFRRSLIAAAAMARQVDDLVGCGHRGSDGAPLLFAQRFGLLRQVLSHLGLPGSAPPSEPTVLRDVAAGCAADVAESFARHGGGARAVAASAAMAAEVATALERLGAAAGEGPMEVGGAFRVEFGGRRGAAVGALLSARACRSLLRDGPPEARIGMRLGHATVSGACVVVLVTLDARGFDPEAVARLVGRTADSADALAALAANWRLLGDPRADAIARAAAHVSGPLRGFVPARETAPAPVPRP